MKDTIVIDMDGTLANVDGRRHHVTGKHRDYDAFHAGIPDDPVNGWCSMLMEAMIKFHVRVVIVSARPKKTEADTLQWLGSRGVYFHELFILRPDGDSTPDQELKRAWLKSYGNERILFVVDDRSKVVKMWREEGITALQCDDWVEKAA